MRRALPILCLWLAACGLDSHHPHLEVQPSVPVGVAHDLDDLPCPPAADPTWLEVWSTSDTPVHLGRMAPDTCEEEDLGVLTPFGGWAATTDQGVVWTVRDADGALLLAFSVPVGADTWLQEVP